MSILFQHDENVTETPIGTEKHQDLLIFGYHCKLFRDDDRALAIDAGEHLIPWMGDQSLKIDRYDGRGHLFDLQPYDADKMDRSATLSSDEIRIERLCEEERYLELHTDIAEKAIQEEEELKRLNMELSETDGYQAVGFSYDQNGEPKSSATAPAEDTQADEEDDLEFIPPPQLNLPKSMSYPSGTKLNALIEKTAKYVSTHGGQMEIMIKTKQASNPQFAFLNFEHHLNPYYKHQVFMIKSGRYRPEIHNKPPPPKPKEEPADDSNSDDDDEDVGYLHPSLRAKSSTASGPSLTTSNSAPSLPQLSQAQLEETPYGRLMKRLAEQQPSLTNSPQRTVTPTFSDTDSTSQTGFPADYSTTTHPTEAYLTDQSYTGAHQYDAYYQQYYLQQGYGAPPPPQTAPPPPQRPASPPDEFKPLIERLLTYVKKDGEAFEKQVLQRNDPRFSFLQPGDANFEYYKWRKEQIILAKLQTNSGTDSPLLGAGRSASSKGVSFSIKQKEPETTSIDTSRVALPVDPESDEEGNENSDGASARAPVESPFTQSIYQGPLPAPPPSTVSEKPALSQEEMQRKQADQKLRDKLAAAAREKMTQVTLHTKDKDLQAARKLKAAMFISMLKSKDKSKQTTIGPELPPKDTPSAESRLSQEPEVHDYDHGRPRSRSPPSAYTVRVNRDRKSSSHRQSGQSRHRQDEYRPHHLSSSSSRSRDHTRDNSPHQSRRRHRSPSPVQSIIKRRKSKSPTTSRGASYSHSRSATNYQRADDVQSSHETSSYEEQTGSNSADNNEFMSKVRQMLKANRQKVYKEDLYGD